LVHRSGLFFTALFFTISASVATASAANLGATASSVIPASARQIISVDNHKLSSDPTARQVEAQVLPAEMRSITSVLAAGGMNPAQDVDRLTFATVNAGKSVGLLGIAEGNFQNFNTAKFFHKTAKNPTPPQYNGTPVYTSQGLMFFMPDNTTMVFGNRSVVHTAIDVQQGAVTRLDANNEMTDLIAGTETTDVWSVLDAGGTRNMINSMAAGTGKIDASTLASHFDGSRYTISFDQDVKVNVELMTNDPTSAAMLSTGLRAAILYRQYQEQSPMVKQLLGNVEVDSAGDHTFLQVVARENQIQQLLHSDLFSQLIR
jgi:hypothetical protein